MVVRPVEWEGTDGARSGIECVVKPWIVHSEELKADCQSQTP